mmetsp:Transcript_32539/g.75962  ORF Transcript_32539/g.75962 Transcript_32539/m.75962 type:complete len:286 (-) Transcript_32539:82-939(-)
MYSVFRLRSMSVYHTSWFDSPTLSTQGGRVTVHSSPTLPPHWWKDMTAWSLRPTSATMLTSSSYPDQSYISGPFCSTMPHQMSAMTPSHPARFSSTRRSRRRSGWLSVLFSGWTVSRGSITKRGTFFAQSSLLHRILVSLGRFGLSPALAGPPLHLLRGSPISSAGREGSPLSDGCGGPLVNGCGAPNGPPWNSPTAAEKRPSRERTVRTTDGSGALRRAVGDAPATQQGGQASGDEDTLPGDRRLRVGGMLDNFEALGWKGDGMAPQEAGWEEVCCAASVYSEV